MRKCWCLVGNLIDEFHTKRIALHLDCTFFLCSFSFDFFLGIGNCGA